MYRSDEFDVEGITDLRSHSTAGKTVHVGVDARFHKRNNTAHPIDCG